MVKIITTECTVTDRGHREQRIKSIHLFWSFEGFQTIKLL